MSAGEPLPAAGPLRRESYTWPLVFLAAVILPQVLVPAGDRIGPDWEVPAVEFVLLVVLLVIAARPGPVPRRTAPLMLALFSLLVAANVVAAARLVLIVLASRHVDGAVPSPQRLLVAAAMLLATNIVTFGLLFWQMDRGGPAGRAGGWSGPEDFQFPQMVGSEPATWIPRFFDYLYVAYTNVTAFSPTDTMPMSHRAKALMVLQSLVSLGVIVVVLARVINVLPSS